MEAKFKDKCYTAAQARKVLTFETESVPVQQFQARCADHILFTNNNGPQLAKVRRVFKPGNAAAQFSAAMLVLKKYSCTSKQS